jgi:hypothetical protein
MIKLLKEYILLEIKKTSFQDILDKIKDENNYDKQQPDIETVPAKNDLEILYNMGIPHNRFKNDQKQNN